MVVERVIGILDIELIIKLEMYFTDARNVNISMREKEVQV